MMDYRRANHHGWEVPVEGKRQELEQSVQRIIGSTPGLTDDLPLNVTALPAIVLTDSQVRITEMPPEILLQEISAGKLSSLEVTRASLKRAAVASRLVNCVAELLQESAEKRATYLDEYFQKHGKTIGPLHGLPVSAKEHMSLKGLDCNAGFVSWMGTKSDSNAMIAQMLSDAGCVFYVRTTQPQTLMQLETSSNIYGVTVNPYNRNLTSGGSSGGEGALLGLRGSCLGIGSDIGGSIRNPAANNGVFGLRPTALRLPLAGLVAPQAGAEQILPVVGPMSTSVPGIELFMKTILDQEPWTRDPSLVPIPWRSISPDDVRRKLRIGVLTSDGIVKPHPPILKALAAMRERLEASELFEIVNFEPYKHDEAWRIASSLYFADGGDEIKRVMAASGEPWRHLSKFILLDNPNVKALTIQELRNLTKQRDQYRTEYLRHRSGVDLILCPAGPGLAPPLDTSKYWSYMSQWNILDYPAIVFPTGWYGNVADKPDASYCPLNEKDRYNQSLCK